MSKTIPNVGSEDARAAVVEAIMRCTRKVPFLGRTINGLKLEFVGYPDVVARTNGRRLQVNPDRFACYDEAQRVGIIAHEAGHVIFRHAQRFPSPLFDHERANRAADYVINGWLLGKGFELPDDCLYDPQYDGLGTREVYNRLENAPQEAPPRWGDFESSRGGVSADPDEVSAEAAAAGLDEILCTEFGCEPRTHKMNLERVLSRLLIRDPVWSRDWRRPNRVSDLLPGWVERDERPRTIVGLDISGSISQEVRSTFLGVVSKVQTPVTVIAVDTHLHPAHIWRNVDRNHASALCAELPMRGGGTLFQPAIDFAARERANLVYLTDGDTGEERLDRKGVPVTWLVWGNDPNIAAMSPCGRLVMVGP